MYDARTRLVVALSFLLVASAAAGIGTVHADHGKEYGNYTVGLPHPSDHYPRGANGYNASITHMAANTQESMEQSGAPNGIEGLSWLVVSSPEVDFSQCSSENTAAFGIDRGNNDSGTHVDANLLDYMEGSSFNKHSIVVDFYEGSDFAAPNDAPINVNPTDEIVAHQGYKSSAGGCFGMPKESGWYQINGKINGTAPSGERVSVKSVSHYFYICECDSEQEAREELGPPPNEQSDGGGEATPTPTATPTATAESADDATATATATPREGTPTATDRPASDGEGATATATARNAETATAERQAGGASRSTGIPTTPTIAEGPGFGAGLALVALLGAALVAIRRE